MADPKILERLRKARTELNQSELAKSLGMSTSTYKRMIDGASPFTIDTIHKASKFFKVSEDVILGRVKLFEEEADAPGPDSFSFTTPITVTLDGSKDTLDFWIKRLQAINKAIQN